MEKPTYMGDVNKPPTIKGPALLNILWEDKPKDCDDVVWRSDHNPIIPRDLLPRSNSIFNSAVVPYEDGFAGIFRALRFLMPPQVVLRFIHGGADTVTRLAYTQADELVEYVKANSEI
jgi:hypothetical protein